MLSIYCGRKGEQKEMTVKTKILRLMAVSVLGKKVCCLHILVINKVLRKLQRYRPGISAKAEQRRLKQRKKLA